MMSPGTERVAPRILVLLATYNGARFIAEQVRSLAAQKDVLIRILASDDGSKDGTADIACRTASEHGLSLEYLPKREPTGSSARNFYRLFLDADFEGCDYVALCDQDDIWLDAKMSRAAWLLDHTGAAGYSCNSIAFWPDGSEKRIQKNYPQRRWDYLFESASHGCTYVITTPIARRFQSFLRTGPTGLHEIQFHDWLLYAWARSSGIRWIMDDQYLIRYRQSDSNVLGANSGARAMIIRLKKLRDGWLRHQSLQIIRTLGLDDSAIASSLRNYRGIDRIGLALRARQCRRRPRDAAMFFLMCLFFGATDLA
jgi:rhamnosyltransferase